MERVDGVHEVQILPALLESSFLSTLDLAQPQTASIKQREFSKHLRIGVKNTAAETIRIYFDYDPEDQKIVVAYCGPHL